MKLIMLGPPGSGKGTVSEKLVDDFNLIQISPGALLREEVDKGTTLGKEIKGYMEKGDLVPNKFVVEMVKLTIKGHNNFILDGFPRAVEQAELIKDIKINAVIYLDVPEDIVIERLSLRRVCSKCGQGFHQKYLPPKQKGICDNCGGKLVRRPDDAPKAVKERFKVYHQKTQPLIDYYKKKKLLKKIDGTPLPKEVYFEVKKLVDRLE